MKKNKTYTINDGNELISTLGDSKKLYGYTPSEKYDANSFVYPITIVTNEKDKTYTVKQKEEEVETKTEEPKVEEKKEEVAATSTITSPVQAAADAKKAKQKKIGMIVGFTILGVVVVVGIVLAIYFGVK